MVIYERLHWLNGRVSNVYLYEDDGGLILIDTGMWGRPDVLGYVKNKLGRDPQEITHILITHADSDHIGNLADLVSTTEAQIFASKPATKHIVEGSFTTHGSAIVDRIQSLVRTKSVNEDALITIHDRDTLPIMGGLQVIATPGHTPDHLSFHSISTGILFAGDAVNTNGRKITLNEAYLAHDYTQAKLSAQRLAARTPALFACGHGTPFLHDEEDLMMLLESIRQDE